MTSARGSPHKRRKTENAGSLTGDIHRLALLPANLILEGEPGVGKRFCAHLIHLGKPGRKPGNFIEITPEISEEEARVILFEKDRSRLEGMLGRAIPRLDAHSVLFLCRIGEFSHRVQNRVERFLTQLETDAAHDKPTSRVIASSVTPQPERGRGKQVVNSLAEHMTHFERFVVPPLRKRQEDILVIVSTILRNLSRKPRKRRLRVDPGILATLIGHRWWDNVRELRLIVEEGAAASPGNALCLPERFFDEPEMISDLLRAIQSGSKVSIEDALAFLEKTIVQRALMRTKFDYGRTSHLLSMTEQNLRYRIRKHNIFIPSGRH